MNNMSKAHDLESEALNSEGLAVDRYGIYLESTEAKINQFKASLEALYMKTISSDTIKGVIDLGTGVLQLIDKIGGLHTVLLGLIAIGVGANISKFTGLFSSMGDKVRLLIPSVMALGNESKQAFIAMNTNMKATEVAAMGLNAALGLIAITISGLIFVYNTYKNMQEEIIQNAIEENKEINSQLNSVDDLLLKYKELETKDKNSKKVREELISIQKELVKHLGYEASNIDLINKSYEENVSIMDKAIERKQTLKQLNEEKISIDAKKDIDHELTGLIASGSRYDLSELELMLEKLPQDVQAALDAKIVGSGRGYNLKFKADIDIDTALKSLEELKSQFELSGKTDTKEYEQLIVYYNKLAENVDKYKSLEEEKNNEIANSIVKSYQLANGIENLNDITKEQYDIMRKDITDGFRNGLSVSAEKAKELQSVLGVLNQLFPQYATESEDATGNITSSLESLDKQISENIASVDKLNSAINTLSQGNNLSYETIQELLETYPSLQDEIIKTGDYYGFNEGALENLRSKEIDESNTAIEAQRNKTMSALNETGQRLGLIDNEIVGVKNLMDAYAILGRLMSKAYEESKQFIGDSKSYVYGSGGVSDSTKKEMGQWATAIGEAEKELSEIEKRKQQIDIATSLANSKGYKAPKASKEKGSKKQKDTTKKDLEDAIKTLQQYRDKIDNEVGTINEKLKLAEMQGNTKEIEKYNTRLDELYTNRVKATQAENQAYQGLKKKYKDSESLSKLNDLIAENEKTYQSDKIKDLEHEISIIDKKIELAKEQLGIRTKQIELEQTLMDEKSPEYDSKQREKYNLLIQEQKLYTDKISALRKKGYKDESDDIKELKAKYQDLEQSKYNMVKWFGDKAKQADLDRIEKQKKATEDLVNTAIELEKKRFKETIDNIKKEDAEYERYWNNRKKELQDSVKEEDWQSDLTKKQSNLNEIQTKLKALENVNDNDAIARKQKLQEEKSKIEEEIKKMYRDKGIEKDISDIDDELERYKRQQSNKVEELEKQANDEVAIRNKVIKQIESKNKTLYNDLIQYSKDYGTISQEEIKNSWDVCGLALDQYADKTKDLIELQKILAQETQKIQDGDYDSNYYSDAQSSLNKPTGNTGGRKMTEREAKEQEQSNQAKYLHEQMVKAKQDGATGMQNWINSEREKWGISKDGKIVQLGKVPDDVWKVRKNKYPIYHNGGIVGKDGGNNDYTYNDYTYNPNTEVFAKLMKGEFVSNQSQIDRFIKTTLPNLVGVNSNQSVTIEKLADINVNGNLDESAIPQLRREFNDIINKLNKNRFGVAYAK